MRYKMVMFDMDGTLIDSFQFHVKCFQRFLMQLGVQLTEKQVGGLIGNTIKKILSGTIPEDRHKEALERLSKFYRNEVDDLINALEMVHGSRETLAKIKEKGLLITLVTNSKKELVDKIALNTEFDVLFDLIRAADSRSLDKSNRCYDVISRYELEPKDVLYVGDTFHDVELAKKMGMTSCLIDNSVSWWRKEFIDLEGMQSDIVVNEITEVLDYI